MAVWTDSRQARTVFASIDVGVCSMHRVSPVPVLFGIMNGRDRWHVVAELELIILLTLEPTCFDVQSSTLYLGGEGGGPQQ